MRTKPKNNISPWAWVSSLYFAQGLPYVAVMTIAVIMYKNLGLTNTQIALYTSWLYLPWVIKPLWSPFVEVIRSKRWWVVTMQSLIAVGFAGVAFSLPTSLFWQLSLGFFWLLAFSSATHDIAADGFYMIALSEGDQSLFVGIRNTFYRIATLFGQGVVVMLAGYLENSLNSVPWAWSSSFALLAALFVGITLYHKAVLPRPENGAVEQASISLKKTFREVGNTFCTFFQKEHIGLILFFLLTYRLGESQLVKIASPFLLDSPEVGGLGLSTAEVGVINGTLGVIALLLGGILGGILVARDGFKRWILPMAIAINLPDILYFFLAEYAPEQLGFIAGAVVIEQLGYGFGFSAYMLFLIYMARGKHQTAHYALGTGFMALGMMLPGMAAGWIQEQLGYSHFFLFVTLSTLPGIVATYLVSRKLEPSFGKKVTIKE